MWLAPNIPIFHTNKTFDFNVGLTCKASAAEFRRIADLQLQT